MVRVDGPPFALGGEYVEVFAVCTAWISRARGSTAWVVCTAAGASCGWFPVDDVAAGTGFVAKALALVALRDRVLFAKRGACPSNVELEVVLNDRLEGFRRDLKDNNGVAVLSPVVVDYVQ